MENENIVEANAEETAATAYTQEDLVKYADKRVTEALQTARSKFEKEKKEAERLASLSAEERYSEELNKRERDIAEREKQIILLENKNTASAVLSEKGISVSLVDLVVADSAEETKKKINILEKEFNASVQKEIEKRIAGNTPSKSSVSEGMTKEEFKKLSIVKQQEILNTNPELFNSLSSL